MKVIRIAVFADTHGNKGSIREVMLDKPFDIMVHLGDGVHDGREVSEELGVEFYGIAGNEDYGSDFPKKYLLKVYSWSLLLIHGHQWEINPYHTEETWEKHFSEMSRMTRQENAHLLLFGHTHEPLLKEGEGIVFCNPGNQYIGSSKPPTFAVVEVNENELTIKIMEKIGEDHWGIQRSLEIKKSIGSK